MSWALIVFGIVVFLGGASMATRPPRRFVWAAVSCLVGLVLLVGGYWAMSDESSSGDRPTDPSRPTIEAVLQP